MHTERDVMKKFILFYIFILICFYASALGNEVNGIVFEDKNNNKKFDTGEPGLAGVAVSNQFDVVLTDEKGEFNLPITNETIIFITKPSGFNVPVDSFYLPKFYYIHQPEGSPVLSYQGIKPTGEIPEMLEFPLYKSQPCDTFEVIVFSDPQPRNSREISYIRDDVVCELIGTPAKFGIVLGDIMYDDISLYGEYNSVISQIGIPFYNVPGNHDMNYSSPDDHYAIETFKRHFGPNYYSFDYGQVHFIALDDVEWQGKDSSGTKIYVGKLGSKQLNWLKNDLRWVPENKLIVLNMHIPIYTFISKNNSVNIVDRDLLFKILKNRKHLLALVGHMHLTEHQYFDQTIGWDSAHQFHQITCAAVSGTWWGGPKNEWDIPIADQRDGVPNGYHIFRFQGNQYSEYFKAAGKDKNTQMRISYPTGTILKNDTLEIQIVANVFNGSEKSIVQYSLDDGRYLTMNNTIMADPHFEMIFKKYKDDYPDWIEPRKCNHIWTATLPNNLKTGIHTLTIKTIDQYGYIYKKSRIFELADPVAKSKDILGELK